MDPTLDLIGSVEFGDWLINECEAATARMDPANIATYKAARARRAALKQAKALLYEFLTLQQHMMEIARGDKPLSAAEPENRRRASTA